MSWVGLIVVLGIGFVPRWHWLDQPWDLDEADYLYAASFGILANALDAQVETPDGVRDLNRIRHRHAPGLQYLMVLWESVVGDDERLLRLCSLFAGLATIVLLWLSPRIAPGLGTWTGPFAAALLAGMPFHAEACKIFNMHPVSVLLLVAVVLALTRALRTERDRDLAIVAVLVALQALMMEYGVITGCTVVLVLLIVRNPWLGFERRETGPRLFGWGLRIGRGLVRAVLLLFAVFFLLWPGGLIHANSVLNFGYYAIEYARAGHPSLVGGKTVFHLPLDTWIGWFWDFAPVFGIAFLAAAAAILIRAKQWIVRPLAPAGVFTVIYLIVLFRQHTFLVRYGAHTAALMCLIIGYALSRLTERRRVAGFVIAVTVIAGSAVTGFERGFEARPGLLAYDQARDVVSVEFDASDRGLAHYASVLRRYLPSYEIHMAPIAPMTESQIEDLEAGVYDYVVLHRYVIARFAEDPGLRLLRRGDLYEALPVIRDRGEPAVWIYRRRRGDGEE